MSESVRKIIIVLIVLVVCVVVGALIINVVAPNAISLVLNGIDSGIYNATGIAVDINGDGKSGNDLDSGATMISQNATGGDAAYATNGGTATEGRAGFNQSFGSGNNAGGGA